MSTDYETNIAEYSDCLKKHVKLLLDLNLTNTQEEFTKIKEEFDKVFKRTVELDRIILFHNTIACPQCNPIPINFEKPSSILIPIDFELPNSTDEPNIILAKCNNPNCSFTLSTKEIPNLTFNKQKSEAQRRIETLSDDYYEKMFPKGRE